HVSRNRVVITGTGAVCGAGADVAAIWGAIQSGQSAIAPIRIWDASRWPIRNAAEVTVENRMLVPDRKLHKMISRTDMFGLFAADQAIQQAGLLSHRETLAPEAA